MVAFQYASVLLLIIIDFLNADMTSLIVFHSEGTRFIPLHPLQLLRTISPIESKFNCAHLCHENPSCRTFAFDAPICQLYDGLITSGQVVSSASTSSIVGGISYDDVDLSASYNKSCDHCYPDRYLVCQDGRCQCPSGTFWNERNRCDSKQFGESSSFCLEDSWCRDDANLTCVCGKCQCPLRTIWNGISCVPQFLQGASCNNSNQCRNDLQLVCSRINKTCSALSSIVVNVTNATMPERFVHLNISLYLEFYQWWLAFDHNPWSIWNPGSAYGPNYMYVTLDDEYLLTAMELTAYGDIAHDPKVIELYADENAMCLAANFSYYQPPSGAMTYPPDSFANLTRPFVARRVLINIAQRWTEWQSWLGDIRFYGIPY